MRSAKRLVTHGTFGARPFVARNFVSFWGMVSHLRVTALAVALLLGSVGHPVYPARTAGPPLRILWIGNSYTFVNDLPKIIAQLADSSHVDRKPEVTGILKGGELLKGHWANPALQEALTQRWDVVVVQEQSTTPITAPDTLLKYGTLIGAAAHKSGAKVVLYVTWPQKKRPAAADTIVAAYRALGNAIHAQLALVGPAWMNVLAQDPSTELYMSDGSHPDAQGSYIAACVFYEVLFGRSPVGLPAIGVTHEEARRAQSAAHKALAENR